MKVSLFFLILVTLVSVRAQEPEPLPRKTDRDAPLFTEPEALMPNSHTSPAHVATGKTKRKTPLAADELKERIRFRQAQTRALHHPDVIDAQERAHFARTDAEKREALRDYYAALYRGMVKIDPALSARVASMREISLHRLNQPHVRPAGADANDEGAEF
jgi:hypothetical protein